METVVRTAGLIDRTPRSGSFGEVSPTRGRGSGSPSQNDDGQTAVRGSVRGNRPGELSERDRKLVEQLKRIDVKVRAHEAAHESAAGALARGKSFQYTVGPDGRRYATGGQVQIDTAPVSGDPQATISKMQVVRRAALAPSDPSSQDLAVAAQARQTEQEARRQLAEEQQGESSAYRSGVRTDDPMSKGQLFSASEYCPSCGSTRLACNHLSAGTAGSGTLVSMLA